VAEARHHHGFSLLEVLIALFILSCGLLSLSAMVVSSLQQLRNSDADSRLLLAASNLAEARQLASAPNGVAGPLVETAHAGLHHMCSCCGQTFSLQPSWLVAMLMPSQLWPPQQTVPPLGSYGCNWRFHLHGHGNCHWNSRHGHAARLFTAGTAAEHGTGPAVVRLVPAGTAGYVA
jgi:prepilin-type N-terminal cleavage/methylation domain-containing protein